MMDAIPRSVIVPKLKIAEKRRTARAALEILPGFRLYPLKGDRAGQ